MTYTTQLLHSDHIKSDFDCGYPLLNSYLLKQAGQDVKKHLSVCYVVADSVQKVIGHYTLSSSGLSIDEIPEHLAKKFPPSYNLLPSILLGRLAVNNLAKGNGLGKFLLLDALKKSLDVSGVIGSIAVIVDPIDDTAKAFYSKYGFIHLPGSKKMFLNIKSLQDLF